jgi:sigma-E factor negative regulatory protein RseC
MIEQNVQVIRCQDDRLWVRLGSQTGCRACDNGQGCGAGLFARLLQRKPVEIELKRNELIVEPGQMLKLALPEKLYVRLVAASYGWPLLAALAGASAAYGLSASLQLDLMAIDLVTLSAGLLSGFYTMRLCRKRMDTAAILNSLQSKVYFLSDTPNMCSRGLSETTENFG